jgi:hypothetical protein
MMRPAVVAAVVVVALAAAPASAQSVFVQGTYGIDVRRFSAGEDERVFDSAVPGLSAAVGGFFSAHVSAGVELDAGGTSTESRSVSLTIAGRPATVTTTYGLRRRTVSALAGFHTGAGGRVRFAAYAGLAFNSVRREIAADAPPIVLAVPPEPSVFTDRTTDPLAGADLAVRVSSRLALVATVRAQGLTLTGDLRGFSIRPGAGLRATF